MMTLQARLSGLKTLVERHPVIWTGVWRLLHASALFLPHDPTYYALRRLAGRRATTGGNGLILDIGANQGISALGFRKLCPRHRIVSFEPNPVHQPALRRVGRRIGNFEFHMVGLGDRPGEFTLFTPRYKSIYLHTFSSLDEGTVRSAIDLSYRPAVRNKIVIEPRICRVRTLDEFALGPEIIKLDVEGTESKVLEGGRRTIEKHKPALILEVCHGNASDTFRLLADLGYKVFSYSVRNDAFTPFDPKDSVPGASGLRNVIAITADWKPMSSLKQSPQKAIMGRP